MFARTGQFRLGYLALLVSVWGCVGPSTRTLPNPLAAHTHAFHTGTEFERQQRWVEARQAYTQYLQQHPDSAAGWHRLAVVCTAQGDHAFAADCFNRGLDLAPNHAELLTDAGYACYVRGEYRAAEPLLQLAVQVQPDNVRAQSNLGLVQGMSGQSAAALATFERVQPRPVALKNLAYLHGRRGEFDRAYACYVEAHRLDPQIVIPEQLVRQFAPGSASAPVLMASAVKPETAPPRLSEQAIPPSPAPPLASREPAQPPLIPAFAPAEPIDDEGDVPAPLESKSQNFVTPVQHTSPAVAPAPATASGPAADVWRPTVVSPHAEAPSPVPLAPVTPAVASQPRAAGAPVTPAAVAPVAEKSTIPRTWTVEVTPATPADRAIPEPAATVRHRFPAEPVDPPPHPSADVPAASTAGDPASVVATPTPEPSAEPPMAAVAEAVSLTVAQEPEQEKAEVQIDVSPEHSISSGSEADRPSEEDVVTMLPKNLEALALSEVCLVSLLEDKQLVRGSSEFTETYESETYVFATATAATRFRDHPRRYRPVAGGHDLVGLKSGELVELGSLQHAAWYRQRLYLFTTGEHLQTFASSPRTFLLDASGDTLTSAMGDNGVSVAP